MRLKLRVSQVFEIMIELKKELQHNIILRIFFKMPMRMQMGLFKY